MSKPWDRGEPARQASYRRLYHRYKADLERLEDTIKFLSDQIKDLRDRVRKLERQGYDEP